MNKLVVGILSFLSLLLLIFAASVGAGDGPAKKLKYYTEQYPPYNFMENGQLQGISVDLLRRMAYRLGVTIAAKDITIGPWTEGYRQVLKNKDTVLFSVTRTGKREKLFQWVGPISPTRIVLFTRKDRPLKPAPGTGLEGLKIGAIRDDIGQQLAAAQGVTGKQLTLSRRAGELVRLLEEGKIDAWAYEETAGKWFIKHEAADPGNIEVSRTLYEGELYFAFHRRTPPAVIVSFQGALDELKKEKSADGSSAYEKIFDHYLKPRYLKDRIATNQVTKLVELTVNALAADAPVTLKAINAGRHPYRDRDDPSLYVFVYDREINMVAHGDNSLLVGKNFRGKTDVEGKAFRDEIVSKALTAGRGWEDYIYTSPKQSGLYYKTTYYQQVTGSDGKTYIVCAGKFKDQP